MTIEKEQVVSYTEDDWKDLSEQFHLYFKPQVPQNTTDDLIKYFLKLKYSGSAYTFYYEAFFLIPYENLPLHINDTSYLVNMPPFFIINALK